MPSVLATVFITVITTVLNTIFSAIVRPIVEMFQATGWLDPDTYSVMSEYCEDLTEYAKAGKLHDAIGRDKEIEELIDILTRDGKGNPCVVGDPGVGKTALVEGLAYRIAIENVPDEFKNKKIIKVNMVNLIAGKAYNNGGGAVGRMRALFDKAREDPNIILFIDEFQQVVQCNAAELFKTYIDRGDIRVIAATTISEYSYISKDPALERRFTKVVLEEPSKNETLEILKSRKDELELKYSVKISENAILTAVNLSERYMKNRKNPDKAIDILNSAVKIVCRKNKISVAPPNNSNNRQNPVAFITPIVTEEDVKNVVAAETSIPMGDISENDAKRLKTMDERIKKCIVGQDEAVKALCDAIRRGRIGISASSKPLASFLFTGTSGVGKTALAETLGEEVGNLVKIDISQYSSQNLLTESVLKKPYSLVLFDGLEKSDRSTLDMISCLLENGYVKDSSGNKVDFTNTIVIMTTNKIRTELDRAYGNEFLNRVDDILVFNKLTRPDFEKIAQKFVDMLEKRLSSGNLNLKISKKVIDFISNVEIDHELGAYQLRRIICEKIERPFAKFITEGKAKKGDYIICDVGIDGITFEVQKKTENKS